MIRSYMTFGLIYKKDQKRAKEICSKASEYLKKSGQEIVKEGSFKEADYLITFGGDGTLIHTACEYAELGIPFVGINVGRLGFLTAVEADGWQKAIDNLIAGKVFISERVTVEATLTQKTFRGVNEVVIKGLYRVIDLEIRVNGKNFITITGDGVIISTQTGSTAYSLSSGGPIVDPKLDCLVLTPINPIGLPIPSAVLSPDDEIEVKLVKGDDVSLVVDGQEHTKVLKGQSVKISKGKYKVKFVYFDKHQFLKSLNAKFGLAGRSIS